MVIFIQMKGYMYPNKLYFNADFTFLFSYHIWIQSISLPYEQNCNEQIAVMSIFTVHCI